MSTDDTMRRIEEALDQAKAEIRAALILAALNAQPSPTSGESPAVPAEVAQKDAGGWGEDDDRFRANEEHERAVEAWAARFDSAMLSYSHDWGLPDEEACKPFGVAEKHAAIRALLNDGVRLMRRQPNAAAEAQAKAAGELLRALNEAMDLIHELRSYCREMWDWKYGKEWDDQTKAVADRIEAAERAGVK